MASSSGSMTHPMAWQKEAWAWYVAKMQTAWANSADENAAVPDNNKEISSSFPSAPLSNQGLLNEKSIIIKQ